MTPLTVAELIKFLKKQDPAAPVAYRQYSDLSLIHI